MSRSKSTIPVARIPQLAPLGPGGEPVPYTPPPRAPGDDPPADGRRDGKAPRSKSAMIRAAVAAGHARPSTGIPWIRQEFGVEVTDTAYMAITYHERKKAGEVIPRSERVERAKRRRPKKDRAVLEAAMAPAMDPPDPEPPTPPKPEPTPPPPPAQAPPPPARDAAAIERLFAAYDEVKELVREFGVEAVRAMVERAAKG